MGIFVTTDLTNETADKLIAFMRTLNLPHIIRKDQYHITVAYSRADFDYTPSKELDGLTVNIVGWDVFGNDSKVLVLRVEHPTLTKRHYDLINQGATSDFPDYKGHITVAVVDENFDTSNLPLPQFPIQIEHEYSKPLKSNFAYNPLTMCENYLPSFQEFVDMLYEEQLIVEANIDDTWKIYGDRIHARMKAEMRKPGPTRVYDAVYDAYPYHHLTNHDPDAQITRWYDRSELGHADADAELKDLHKRAFQRSVMGFHDRFSGNYMKGSDPTGLQGKYLPWIAREYATGHINRYEDVESTIADQLERYHAVKSKPSVAAQYNIDRNIMNYHVQEPYHFLRNHLENLDKIDPDKKLDRLPPEFQRRQTQHLASYLPHALKNVPDELTLPDVQPHEYTKIDEPHWTVVIPHTENAACKYGAGTKWCTAARNGNMFDHYNENGKLSIFIPKVPRYTGEKYQLHITPGETERTDQGINYHPPEVQFMNDKDTEADPEAVGLTHYYSTDTHGPLPRSGQAFGGQEYGFSGKPNRYSEHFHERTEKEYANPIGDAARKGFRVD